MVVSSCHGEGMADLFLGCGVQHVLTVKKEWLVSNRGVIDFLTPFYKHLLIHNRTVEQSFHWARQDLRSKAEVEKWEVTEKCCCMHEHRPECRYREYYRNSHIDN